ncbi:hypothetical protein XOCgx_3673 [Xanthomonas oryzae pv. oryzicola]|nr:hypothetical protein XOCgx_3673 [Xanthomonas oryzae pv. oryzicola]
MLQEMVAENLESQCAFSMINIIQGAIDKRVFKSA